MKICVCETVKELGEKTHKAFYFNGPAIGFAVNYEEAIKMRKKSHTRDCNWEVIIFTVDPEAKKKLLAKTKRLQIAGFCLFTLLVVGIIALVLM